MTGFKAGEIVVLTDTVRDRHGQPILEGMIGSLAEIAEARVWMKRARYRQDTSVVFEEVPMQFCRKPRTHEPLGAYPIMWMQPYQGDGLAKPRDLEVIDDPEHKWLMLDPANAVMR